MRRRPPAPIVTAEMLQAGKQRADDLQTEISLSLRDADPVDAPLPERLDALQAAAIRAAGGDADLLLAAVVAARQAAEDAAGSEGLPLRERVRIGDLMTGDLVRAFRPAPAPRPTHH